MNVNVKPADNLGKIMRHFTGEDLAVIAFALNTYVRAGQAPLEPAMVAFVPIKYCKFALAYEKTRRAIGLRKRIEVILGRGKFEALLYHGKVAKHFGAHPERGRPIPPILMKRDKVTVGVRWSLPKRDYVPDDNVLVRPVVALKFKSGSHARAWSWWEVHCEPIYWPQVEMWLIDHCR